MVSGLCGGVWCCELACGVLTCLSMRRLVHKYLTGGTY